jgi:acetyl esterase/lipase
MASPYPSGMKLQNTRNGKLLPNPTSNPRLRRRYKFEYLLSVTRIRELSTTYCMMSLLHSEWTAFLVQNPTVSHDDESRNERFFSSADGRVLAEQVSSVDTTVPTRDNHRIPIRIYTPKDHSSDAVVIFYHSGGFVQGSVDTEDSM